MIPRTGFCAVPEWIRAGRLFEGLAVQAAASAADAEFEPLQNVSQLILRMETACFTALVRSRAIT